MSTVKLQLAPGIYRLDERKLGYSRISDVFARDGKLSMRARSVGLYLLSHREGFVLQQGATAEHLEMAPNTFRGALDDLAARGYVRYGTTREGRRVVGTWYVIHDEPLEGARWDAEVARLASPLTSNSEVRDSGSSEPDGSTDEGSKSELHKGYQFNAGQPSTSTPSVTADAAPREPAQPPLINPPVSSRPGVEVQDQPDGTPEAAHVDHLTEVPPERSCSAPPTRKQLATQYWPEFWAAYDRKLSKGAAAKAWTGAIVRHKADPREVIAAARRYRATFNGDRTYMKHPATWLNAQGWLDEPETVAGPPSSPEGVRERLRQLAGQGDAETAAREAGLAWPGWDPSEAARWYPELPPGDRLRRWGQAWIERHEAELVDGMTRRAL